MHLSTMLMIVITTSSLIAETISQPTRNKYCGSHLADALKLACGATGYNPPAWAEDFYGKNANKTRYVKSLGVATECCYTGCSWRTLTSYCAEPVDQGHKSKKSVGDEDFGGPTFDGLSNAAESGVGDLMGAAPEIEVDSIRRSAPVFGTVSPEYLRLPRTLDEVPPYPGMPGY